ncbi:MAG: hypothetical protein ABIQ73_26555 [Acidimicrobiales bacterium]
MTKVHWRRVGVCTALCLGSLAVPFATPVAAADHLSLHGTFRETATGGSRGYNISGSAKLTIEIGATTATVNIAGLDPTKTYGSHLHNGTCASGGGGHYQNSAGGPTTPPNELWLSSTDNPLGGLIPNKGGVAHGEGTSTWAARIDSTTLTNARSIVVHEPVPGGPRIACADLT